MATQRGTCKAHLKRSVVMMNHVVDHLMAVHDTYKDFPNYAEGVQVAAVTADQLKTHIERCLEHLP